MRCDAVLRCALVTDRTQTQCNHNHDVALPIQLPNFSWSAWADLAALCSEKEALRALASRLRPHVARDFFMGHALLSLQANEEALGVFNALAQVFPITALDAVASAAGEGEGEGEGAGLDDSYALSPLESVTGGSGRRTGGAPPSSDAVFVNLHLLSQTALALYHLREFDAAEARFEALLRHDPFRLRDVDVYRSVSRRSRCVD